MTARTDPVRADEIPKIDPSEGVLGLACAADFPSRTMTFHVPRGTYAIPGIYEIKWVRQATAEEFDAVAGLPDPFRCPDCDGAAQ